MYTYKVYIHNILIKNGLQKFKSIDTVKRVLLTFINSNDFRVVVDKVMLRYNNPNQFAGDNGNGRPIIGLQDPKLLIDKLLVNASIIKNGTEIFYLKNMVFRPNEREGSDGIKRDYNIMSEDERKKLNRGGLEREVTKTDFTFDILEVDNNLDELKLERLKFLIGYEESTRAKKIKRGGEYKKVRKLLEQQYNDYKNEALLDGRIKRITEQLGIKEVDNYFLKVIKYYYYPTYENQYN